MQVMNYIKTLISTLLFSTLFMGCIEENMDDCGRTELFFCYKGDENVQVFKEKVAQVNLYVFDEKDCFIDSKIISRQELSRYQGTSLNLSPGNYRLVCVGNQFENTELRGLASGQEVEPVEVLLAHPACFDGTEIPGNDSLYMGTANLKVSGNKALDTVHFNSSHVKMYVEVRGIDQQPKMELCNVCAHVNFACTSCEHPCSYYPMGNYDADRDVFLARFNVTRFKKENPIVLELHDPVNGEVFFSLSIEEFLQDNPNIDMSRQEVLVPILIEFKNVGVTVSVPEWAIEDLKPEF